MAMKTEAIFTSLMRNKTGSTRRSTSQKKDDSTVGGSGGLGGGVGKSDNGSSFFSASYYEHVKPMFQLIWMSILTAISAPLQETDDLDTISVALDGFRSAIYISCLFDMDLETKAFVSTLGKFTILNNIQEMRAKNFEAIKALLDVAYQQGNSLSDSWSVVVQCISQLEKLQIVAGLTAGEDSSRSRGVSERTSPRRDQAQRQPGKGGLLEDVAAEASSQSMTLLVDRIFTASAKLSGPAIVHFVRALCDSSWEEITSSSDKEHPRMYCLQRLVEISYYNMKRIRVEWSQLWAILGQHFNQVGSYPNTNVAFFAVDKLRQLTMKFLELEELPNFKFQKDFLRPFEEILRNNVDVKVKDMCLACIQQIAQAKAKSLKSGWKTLFGVLLRASREATESIVVLSFDITKGIFKSSFDQVVLNAAYPEFVACVVEFCKNTKFGKISLHAIELLRQSIGRVAEMLEKQERAALLKEASMMNATPLRANLETDEAAAGQLAGSPARGLLRQGLPDEDVSFKYWMPVLFGLHDVIMASDLEVRTRGLQYLFETLKAHGSQFSPEFWGLLAKGVLFPIFEDLKHSGATSLANSKFADKEQMLVWLSTTLIQALRQLVDLFSFYFESLHFMLDGMLDILKTCLTHENEALSRIGSTCLQQLIEHNVARLGDKEWSRIVDLFEKLCEETTPYFLFFDLQAAPGSNSDASSINPADLDDSLPFLKSAFGPPPDKKEFQRLIGKCVLHLLVIQTLDDVMLTGPNDVVYKSLGPTHLQCLTNCFDRSFRFARAFNNYTELRTALYRMGYMKQMPNLLKQETLSVTAFIRYMAKAALDKSTGRSDLRGQSEQRFVELCLQILSHFNTFDSEAKRRNINSWKPVVVMILNALVDLDDDQFARHIRSFYTHLVNLLLHDTGPELRLALHTLLMRTGVAFAILSNDMYVSSIAAASAGDGLSAGQTRSPDSLASPEDASISGGGMG
ncbi:hypothetical protein BC831DRAFT_159184 [Entophlyctis helioformis]|nr:hypothetical protein BC831DRAFT_159184 [Entophlyctis helioformis]